MASARASAELCLAASIQRLPLLLHSAAHIEPEHHTQTFHGHVKHDSFVVLQQVSAGKGYPVGTESAPACSR